MRIWQGQHSRTAVVGIASAAFAVCCLLPLAYLIATTLRTASGAYGPVALDSRRLGLLYNTTLLGVGTAMVATTIGAPLGFALARVPLRRKALLRILAAVPVLLPPYVVALAWLYLGGTYGLAASILVMSLILYPVSMLATETALRRIDGRLEEAGLTVAMPLRVIWRITLPLAGPSVMAAALIIFVLAVSEFGVPGLLQVRVYTTEVFTAFAALYDSGRALVLAAPLLGLCVAVAAVAAVLLGDRLVTRRRSMGAPLIVLDRWRRPAGLAIAVVVATAVALPLLALVREAGGARSVVSVVAGSLDAIVNSLMLAGAGATVVVALAFWLGYAQARADRPIQLAAQILLVVLFAVPSTIVGVGLIGVWNRSGPMGALYGTDAMFLLVYLARFVPVAALILAATAQTISLSQEEAAAVSGAGWLRTVRAIVLPQLRVGLVAAWIIVFVLAFGELGASILVAPPGEATLPIRVYTIIANTPASNVAVLALLQSFVIFIPVAALGAYVSLREAR